MGALVDTAGFDADSLGELVAARCLVRSTDATFVGRSPIELLAGQVGRPGETVLADLVTGHESWLERALIASNADALYLLLPNGHPDTRARTGKALSLRWSQASISCVSCVANRPTRLPSSTQDARVPNWLAWRARAVFLGRANATLRSALVDALYKAARSISGQATSKEVAREQADALVADVGATYAEASVLSLPRDVSARARTSSTRWSSRRNAFDLGIQGVSKPTKVSVSSCLTN